MLRIIELKSGSNGGMAGYVEQFNDWYPIMIHRGNKATVFGEKISDNRDADIILDSKDYDWSYVDLAAK